MKNLHPLFQQILGAQGAAQFNAVMKTEEQLADEQKRAEQYVARIADLRAKLVNGEHLWGVK